MRLRLPHAWPEQPHAGRNLPSSQDQRLAAKKELEIRGFRANNGIASCRFEARAENGASPMLSTSAVAIPPMASHLHTRRHWFAAKSPLLARSYSVLDAARHPSQGRLLRTERYTRKHEQWQRTASQPLNEICIDIPKCYRCESRKISPIKHPEPGRNPAEPLLGFRVRFDFSHACLCQCKHCRSKTYQSL